jgi:hypothetical protein
VWGRGTQRGALNDGGPGQQANRRRAWRAACDALMSLTKEKAAALCFPTPRKTNCQRNTRCVPFIFVHPFAWSAAAGEEKAAVSLTVVSPKTTARARPKQPWERRVLVVATMRLPRGKKERSDHSKLIHCQPFALSFSLTLSHLSNHHHYHHHPLLLSIIISSLCHVYLSHSHTRLSHDLFLLQFAPEVIRRMHCRPLVLRT